MTRKYRHRVPVGRPAFLQRLARVEELGIAESWINEKIEEIAVAVARLPEPRLLPSQKRELQLIARELLRRAGA
jgi:hypothetical protein